ncbi:ubiquitin-conjugating enzyme E2 22 isoform X2 [Cryptomeria japonica]|nr:ubiquitin-conjugating enzyme E2 22 isoform X2 [Cryptomeria japonica]
MNDDILSVIFADIEGPADTPYEGGLFRIKLILPQDFPCSPPKGYFMTKIFHPNIAHNGEICVNILKKDWQPALGLRHVLIVVRCLLIEPFPESALNEQAGKMLMENYEEYSRHARFYTSIHAMKHKARKKETPESPATNERPENDVIVSSSPLTACNTNKENAPDPNVGSIEEIGVGELTQKTDASQTKVLVAKKKIDQRKKCLRRL